MRTTVTPSEKGERHLSPPVVKLVVTSIALFPLLLGIALLMVTPRETFLNPVYWIGLGLWAAFGAILIWHEISRQMPEAEHFRHARSARRESQRYAKWVSVALLVLVLGVARASSGAPSTSAPGAFLLGMSGLWFSTGIGFAVELIGREKLLYCSTCEGHRWFIHYWGHVVCRVCGHTWGGRDQAWQRPSVDASRLRAKHAALEYFASGPLMTFVGIFGVVALPQIGLADWVGVPLLMMFGGVVSSFVLWRRFHKRVVAELRTSS